MTWPLARLWAAKSSILNRRVASGFMRHVPQLDSWSFHMIAAGLLSASGLLAEEPNDWRGEAQRLAMVASASLDALPAMAASAVTALAPDWQTGGAWVGRYGRLMYMLCGMGGSVDYGGGQKPTAFACRAYLGEARNAGDGLRRWIHWAWLPESQAPGAAPAELVAMRSPLGMLTPAGMPLWGESDVRRVLLNPVNGGRRQAEWDDHAEGYAPWFARRGPNMYLDVSFPAGQFLLSLYFVNKDAQGQSANRYRDYRVTLVAHDDRLGRAAGWEAAFDQARPLAEARVTDFHDGVYLRFVVVGPSRLVVRIAKGDSINTILSGVFLDAWEAPAPAERQVAPSAPELLAALRQLKSRAPDKLTALAPQLLSIVGSQVARLKDEALETYVARLSTFAAVLDCLLEYDARDSLWPLYLSALAEGMRRATPEEYDGRKWLFRRCWQAALSETVMTEAQAAACARAYATTLLAVEKDRANFELYTYARNHALDRPREALAVLQALADEMARQQRGIPVTAFGPEDLFAWAMCHRQVGEHTEALLSFEMFLRRFPQHALAAEATARLPQERASAKAEAALRQPVFTVAPAAPRPD